MEYVPKPRTPRTAKSTSGNVFDYNVEYIPEITYVPMKSFSST